MKRSQKILILTVGILIAIGVILPALPSSLVQLWSICACYDEPRAILNPFRDRAPERAGTEFLDSLAADCTRPLPFMGKQEACAVAEDIKSGFELFNRHDGFEAFDHHEQKGVVEVVYRTKSHEFLFVSLASQNGQWKVVDFYAP